MSIEDIKGLLRLARAYCAEKLPWFAPALFRAKLIITSKIEVAAIDRNYNIYFNPEAVRKVADSCTTKQEILKELGFLWIHEISHVLRQHMDRCADMQAHKIRWNAAADLEINDGTWEGLTMPKAFQGLLPHQYHLESGKLAEFYYSTLGDQHLKHDLESIFDNVWNEGSGVHGHKESWEIGQAQQTLHPIDLDLIKNAVAQKIFEHRVSIGNIPGSWNIWIENVLQSKTDWKKVLRHKMSTAVAIGIGLRVDYSFHRPSRRQAVYHPFIVPSFSGSLSGKIAVVVDTSGSMQGSLLEQAIGEVYKVLDDFKLPITVIPCDAIAYEPIVMQKPSDRFKIRNLSGGGGTDMTVGIQAALELKPTPDAILVLTDGYTPYPNHPFKIPVVFGIIKNDLEKHQPPMPPSPPWKKSDTLDIIIKL